MPQVLAVTQLITTTTLVQEPPQVLVFLASGLVLSPPGCPLVPTVPVGSRIVPVLAAALAALQVDRGEVASAQDTQGLAEGEGQAVTLADKAWRGGRRQGHG